MLFSPDITSRGGGGSAIMNIHHFVLSPRTTDSDREPFLPSNIDPIIVEDAYRNVKAATSTSNWTHVRTPNQKSKYYRPGPGKVVYEYSLCPPSIAGCGHQGILPEWGEGLVEEVPESLEKLPEFVCSNLFLEFDVRDALKWDGDSIRRSDAISEGKDAALFSTHDLIPQPHFYPSPTSSTQNYVSKKITGAFFRKSNPIPIPPYSRDEVTAYLSSPFSRSAWLIPIRTFGCVIYPGSSQAFVSTSGSSHEEASLMLPRGITTCIHWFPEAVTVFWNDLLTIRQRGKLGPIGLSYHFAVAPPPLSSSSVDEHNLQHLSRNSSAAASAATLPFAAITSSSADDQPATISLLAMDYIKIYHDVSQTMQLRTVLDAWKPPGQQQARILKGCSLVLLDERSRGVLIL